MNWDWDKLQEKRKQQNTWDFGKKINNTPEPEEDFGFDAETEKKNFEEFFKQPNEFFKKAQLPGIKWVFILFVLVWLASGIFIVKPDEAGVILRCGAYTRTESAGLHYHLPYPIETVILPNVSRVRQAEVGFRSAQNADIFQQGRTQAIDDEGSMLTGDENIVNIQFNIQYNIKPDGAFDYLFNVTQPDALVKKAAEAAMREVIGRTTLDSALTGGRVEIQNNVTELLQSILDRYQVGVQVVAVQMQDVQPPKDVQEAFKDVASAREDKQRLINIAEAYRRRTSRKNVCSMKVWKKCSATRKWKKWFCPMKEQTKSCLSFLWETALLPAWKKLCQIPLRKTFFPATFPKTPRSKLQIPPALTQEVHVNE